MKKNVNKLLIMVIKQRFLQVLINVLQHLIDVLYRGDE